MESAAEGADGPEAASFRALQERLEAIEHQLAALTSGTNPASASGADDLPAGFYAELEARFRGPVPDIRARQSSYLPDLEAVPPGGDVLDLGCGRGEFLSLLRDHDIDAWGVDSDGAACEGCRRDGLRVEQADLLDTLRTLSEGSLRAVVTLQVVEHLRFPVLLEVMSEVSRVLKPGGLLILETPNGANISVGAATFWLDPTHVRPLHPLMLRFLAERVGLEVRELRGSSPSEPAWALPPAVSTEGGIVGAVSGLQELLLGPQDVALLASRPV